METRLRARAAQTRSVSAASAQLSESPSPSLPPVIPAAIIDPDWQLSVVAAGLALVEVWDVLQPTFFPSQPPSILGGLRVGGVSTAALWTACELGALMLAARLRVPGMPQIGGRQVVGLGTLVALWNILILLLADPTLIIPRLSFFGPTHVGEEGLLLSWVYLAQHAIARAIVGQPEHLGGKHTIRLLPFSTATLNPLGVHYCIPPRTDQPLYIPIVFNNSLPDSIAYYARSLETGHANVVTVSSAALRRPPGKTGLQIASGESLEEDDDADVAATNPLSALVLRQAGTDVAKHSVRPADSLAAIAAELSASQSILYLAVREPAVISLKSASDKRGDHFHVTPRHEAVVIECPTGGEVVSPHSRQPVRGVRETRCVGDEDIVTFQARGVAPLRAAWTKKSGDGKTEHGVLEGIEDDADADGVHGQPRRAAKTHAVPLRVSHDRPGDYTVQLVTITDAMHNSYAVPSAEQALAFRVLPRRSVSLTCQRPIELLVNGSTTIGVRADGPVDNPLDITYVHTSITGDVKQSVMRVGKPQEAITVREAGTYRLLDVDGQCSGSVLEPSTCVVSLVPPPTAALEVTTLHEWYAAALSTIDWLTRSAQDVGVTVSFDFSGTPPFLVKWTEKRKGGREETRQQRFEALDGTLELRPEKEGLHTYASIRVKTCGAFSYVQNFLSLSDSKYKNLPLDHAPIEQVVRPPASVEIVGPAKRSLHACSGDDIEVALDIAGNDPLRLAYRTVWGASSRETTVDAKSGKNTITITVPDELKSHTGASGKLSIILLSVEDGKGCVKRLPHRSIDVDINRQKPTARFVKGGRHIVKDGDAVEVPMRLTGQAPWTFTYVRNGETQRPITIRHSNSPLRLTKDGTYRLVEVKDAHCEGDVDDSLLEIGYKPKPTFELVATTDVAVRDGVHVHRGLCAGEEDQVAMRFSGRAPYELAYRYSIDGKASEHVLRSAQEMGMLYLDTRPGHHEYHFHRLQDVDYDNIPVAKTLRHDVHSRPSATFARQNTKSLCLESAIATNAKVKLYGKAPFVLTVSSRRPGSADVATHAITVDAHEWTPALPGIVKDVGTHEIAIVAVADASGCDEVIHDADVRTTTVEVVETASVVAVSHETDVCVGDALDFVLLGKAPWVVGYSWAGKTYSVTSSSSRFTRSADKEGVFEIVSVALKDKSGNAQCERHVQGMVKHVHRLPSVKIEDGADELREGDQPAVFGVSFSGTPPFTFTYTRSEKIGSRYKVVETQTITDVWADHYTISSSQPGEYAVTTIADKYCRYPPLSRARSEA